MLNMTYKFNLEPDLDHAAHNLSEKQVKLSKELMSHLL